MVSTDGADEFLQRKVFMKGCEMILRLRTVRFLIALFLVGVVGGTQDASGQGEWKERWAKVVEAGKKEGKVVIYGGSDEEGLYQAFQQRYPEIKVSYVLTYGGKRGEQIAMERRSGRYLADLCSGGSTQIRAVLYPAKALDPIKSALILPEVVDESKWWRGKHVYLDDEREYIFSFNGITQSYFHYNTKLVNPKEIRSYWDLLNPKWKGKILAWEPMAPGTDGVLRFLYHNPEIGPQFLRRLLTEMGLTVTRDTRQFVDWLGTGKFSIAAFQSSDRADVAQAQNQGLPINWFDPRTFKEGVPLSTSSGNIAFLNRAPNPNAAKVFLNWLLSREGQIVYQKIARNNDSLRIDIPKDDVPPHVRRADGVKYAPLLDPAYLDLEPVRRLVNEIARSRK